MNANQLLGTARQLLGIIAMCAAAIAVLKVMGFGVPVRASVIDLAAVAAACGLAK